MPRTKGSLWLGAQAPGCRVPSRKLEGKLSSAGLEGTKEAADAINGQLPVVLTSQVQVSAETITK